MFKKLCIVMAMLLVLLAASCAFAEEVEAPHEHSFGEWVTRTQPTCTKDGEKVRLCACGESEKKSISATGHSFGDWNTRTQPTCTSAGEKVRLCACGETEKESIPAKGHAFGAWQTRVEPTCNKAGEKVRLCACGETEKESIPATGNHAFGDWQTRTQPTCTVAGEKVRLCACGETEKESIPAKGHSFGEWKTRTEPTCGKDGEKVRLCECGETEKEAIPATGEHKYVFTKTVKPTTSSKGYDLHTCEVCGAEKKDNYTAKLKSSSSSSSKKKAAPVATATPAPDLYASIVSDVDYAAEEYEEVIGTKAVEGVEAENNLLTIVAAAEEDGTYALRNLHLSVELLAELKAEGIEYICFVVGEYELTFPISMFDAEEVALIAADIEGGLAGYIITVDPAAVNENNEAGCAVSAVVTNENGDEIGLVGVLTGMILANNGTEVEVVDAQVYTFAA